jgi:type II secretory ATPase GspE/PulE/Tfp pilus assembly ATPase PilB-like protein
MRRATDIHIETYENDIDLRFRIDGVLVQVTTPLSVGNIRGVITRLKVLSNLDISDRRNPQDGRVNAQFTDAQGTVRRICFRSAILPGPFGEDAVLRVLDEDRTRPALEDLGMNPRLLADFREMITSPGGLILVTGPTASGKTTTLYGSIHSISLSGKKILTVEDPIEFELPKVNQKQVTGILSFADYARAFMRQNPDVLMIGEIRDEETAAIALKASQMGHLVFSTLHTPDAISAIGRLVMLGLEKSLVLSTLLGILSQRLVRKICPSCRETYVPEKAVLAKAPGLAPTGGFQRGRGCQACGKSGYYDRTGVFELIRIDDKLRDSISLALDVSLADIAHTVEGDRMFDDALKKVAQGVTTLEEVIRVVPFPRKTAAERRPEPIRLS